MKKWIPIVGSVLVLLSPILPYTIISVPIIGQIPEVMNYQSDVAYIVLLIGVMGLMLAIKQTMTEVIMGLGAAGLVIAIVTIPMEKAVVLDATSGYDAFGQAVAVKVEITPGVGLILLGIGCVMMICSGLQYFDKDDIRLNFRSWLKDINQKIMKYVAE